MPEKMQRGLRAIKHLNRAGEVLRCQRGTREFWRVTAAYLGFGSLQFPHTIAVSGNTFRLQEQYDLQTLWQIYFRRIYDVRSEDRLILDLGANIGLFSCFAAVQSRQARVYAVEPFPSTFDRLIEHTRLNGVTERVHCMNVAVNRLGTDAMMLTEGMASQMFRLATKGQGTIAVSGITLANLLSQIGCPVDFMKMDIEGSEYDVLLSTDKDTLANIKRATVEYHEPLAGVVGSPELLIQHLASSGLRLTRRVGESQYGLLYFDRE